MGNWDLSQGGIDSISLNTVVMLPAFPLANRHSSLNLTNFP